MALETYLVGDIIFTPAIKAPNMLESITQAKNSNKEELWVAPGGTRFTFKELRAYAFKSGTVLEVDDLRTARNQPQPGYQRVTI